MKRHLFEIHHNAEGSVLAYAGVVGDGVCYRIAGPKAWGGSRKLAEIEVRGEDLVEYIKMYAPDVLSALQQEQPHE